MHSRISAGSFFILDCDNTTGCCRSLEERLESAEIACEGNPRNLYAGHCNSVFHECGQGIIWKIWNTLWGSGGQ